MKQLTNKDYEEYRAFLKNRSQGRILTPDGLRFICELYNYNPTKIGQHFLEMLPLLADDNT